MNEWYVRINPGSGVCSWTHGDIAVKAVMVKSPGHLFWEYIHVLPSHNIFISRKYVNGPFSCITAFAGNSRIIFLVGNLNLDVASAVNRRQMGLLWYIMTIE